jgi:predicted anti-sigma-YlaC factor YlaD
MGCEQARAALSARLDGEEPATDSHVDAHVVSCADCRAWLVGAEHLTRLLRAPAAEPTPDRTEAILAAVAANVSGRGQRRPAAARRDQSRSLGAAVAARRQVLRLAVAGFAVAQLLAAIPALLASIGIAPLTHLDHELGAFDATVAVVFLLAAWRPRLAWAYAPLACSLGLLLGVTSGLDIARGATTIGHETGHLAVVIQAVLLWQLARTQRQSQSPRIA